MVTCLVPENASGKVTFGFHPRVGAGSQENHVIRALELSSPRSNLERERGWGWNHSPMAKDLINRVYVIQPQETSRRTGPGELLGQ